MKALCRPILLFVLILLLPACRSRNQYASKPAKTSLTPESETLEVNPVAFHNNDSTTTVFLEVKNENVLYKRPDTAVFFYAQLRISYVLMLEHNTRKIIDSSSFYIYDMATAENVTPKSLYSEFDVEARMKNNYYLSISVFDMNRRIKYNSGLNIRKQNRLLEQNFLVLKNDSVVFRNNFSGGEKINVLYSDAGVEKLTVDCFLKEFGPALPPFTTNAPDEFRYMPDSVFTVNKEAGKFVLRMPPLGFFHLKAEAGSKEGLTLRTFDAHYPGVGSSEEMINCARYIMSRDEYEACLNAVDKKAAIDKFWLGIAGSNERARELLKRYYGRVKEANKHYTSYTQGWKTDRGMIFIVFGYPANVYHSRKDEVWVYGNEANPASLRFVFNKTNNPFSDNDYVMERSQFYKDQWHLAVDFWREGHVYYDGRR